MQKKGRTCWISKPLAYMLDDIERNEKLSRYEAQCRLVEHAMVGKHIEKVNPFGVPMIQHGFEKDKKKKKKFLEMLFQ